MFAFSKSHRWMWRNYKNSGSQDRFVSIITDFWWQYEMYVDLKSSKRTKNQGNVWFLFIGEHWVYKHIYQCQCRWVSFSENQNYCYVLKFRLWSLALQCTAAVHNLLSSKIRETQWTMVSYSKNRKRWRVPRRAS